MAAASYSHYIYPRFTARLYQAGGRHRLATGIGPSFGSLRTRRIPNGNQRQTPGGLQHGHKEANK